ncbi:MAG: DUF2812 domain-containing protein [Aristaeellaceae bacterium]
MAERKIVYKVFFIWDWEGEEAWLNNMSHRGWQLEKVGFCRYTFVKGEPDQYQYRLQALSGHPGTAESQEYIGFVESTGAELVDTYLYWAYFRRATAEGPFQLFSDVDSRVKHMKRIRQVIVVLMPFLILNFFNLLRCIISYDQARSPFFLLLFAFYAFIFAPLFIIGLVRIQRKITLLQSERALHE